MKVLTLLLFWVTVSCASDISYSIHVDTLSPYRDEAVVLDVNITQLDHTKVMLFNFTPKESADYTFYQIDFKEDQRYHDLKHYYQYLIYPKRSGQVAVEFELIKSLTDDDKVAYAISGDRDNVKGLVKKDIPVEVEPMVLDVKPTPNGAELVGDFVLEYKLDKVKTDAYEPVNLKVSLEGWGSVPSLNLLEESSQYHLFTHKPEVQTIHTDKGTKNRIEWRYAISAKEGFVLPKVVLKGFNPQRQKSYELVIPEYKVMVNPVDIESLIDSENNPPPSRGIDWSWLWGLLSYVVVFVAGYLVPREFWQRKRSVVSSDEDRLAQKVAATTTHKELLTLLLSENRGEDRKAIEALESVLYNGKKISLEKIKKMFNFSAFD